MVVSNEWLTDNQMGAKATTTDLTTGGLLFLNVG